MYVFCREFDQKTALGMIMEQLENYIDRKGRTYKYVYIIIRKHICYIFIYILAVKMLEYGYLH